MKDLQFLIKELYDNLDEWDDKEFIQKSTILLKGYSKSSVLIANFLAFPDSRSHALLIYLGYFFESLQYEDIWKAMAGLGDKFLPAYHFSVFMPEVFGIDLKQAAIEYQRNFPDDKDKVDFFINLKVTNGQSKNDIELLKEYGADPVKIGKSLRASGTPMVPFPNEL